MTANSRTLFPFLCGTSESWHSLLNFTVQKKSAISNFIDVRYLLVVLPHECVSICKRLHLDVRVIFHTTGFLPVSTAGCALYTIYCTRTDMKKVEFFFNFTSRMFTYTSFYVCLAHPLESWIPFDIEVDSAYTLLTMPVTYKPTNIVDSPFINLSGTSAYKQTQSNTSLSILTVGEYLARQEPLVAMELTVNFGMTAFLFRHGRVE